MAQERALTSLGSKFIHWNGAEVGLEPRVAFVVALVQALGIDRVDDIAPFAVHVAAHFKRPAWKTSAQWWAISKRLK